eukprot:jgi/Bigna1/79724/fgenesh1_pg.65_\
MEKKLQQSGTPIRCDVGDFVLIESFELMGLSELWACLLKDGDTKQTGISLDVVSYPSVSIVLIQFLLPIFFFAGYSSSLNYFFRNTRNVFFIEVWEKAVQTTNAMCHRKNELLTTAETAADKLNFYSASSNERQVEMKNKAPSTINMTEEIERANERKEGIQQIDGGFQEQDDAAAGRRWFSRTRSQL